MVNRSLSEIVAAENNIILSYGNVLQVPEAHEELNDLQREKISYIRDTFGKAYIFSINSKEQEKDIDGFYVEYTGQLVTNFECDCVVQTKDTVIMELVNEWRKTAAVPVLNKIFNRLRELDGLSLIWK